MWTVACHLLRLPPDDEPLGRIAEDRRARQAHGLRALRHGAPLAGLGPSPLGPGGAQVGAPSRTLM
eukprot:11133280-Alexandrium_andersonii.AAC.1